MHVAIHTAAVNGDVTSISNDAAARVRMGFNPSKRVNADRMKALAAAFMTECEIVRDAGGPGARDAAVAITQMQGASMFAVAAATADL